jgi:glycosyltransferase involved in cell wall biosynthesis
MRAGGIPSFVSESSAALAGVGVDSKILATNLGEAPTVRHPRKITDAELPQDAPVLDIELFDFKAPVGLAHSPDLARRVEEIVSEFDLVHIHSLWFHPQWAAQRAARKQGVPYVISPHGTLDRYLRSHRRFSKGVMNVLWQNKMLENAAALHVATERERENISDIAPAVPRGIAPCGVWADRFAKPGDGATFREREFGGADEPIVMFLGRITFKKRLDILIEAFAEHARGGGAGVLAIVGPDDETLVPGLEAQAAELGIGERVRFTGPLFDDDRADALAAATVWALSSETENFGIAVIEALACGIPVLVSDGVSVSDEIAAREAGVVVPLETAEFARALSQLLGDPALRGRLSENGLALAVEYDWRAVAPKLKRVYELAVGG